MKPLLRIIALMLILPALTNCAQILSIPGRILSIPGRFLGKNEKTQEALEQLAKTDSKDNGNSLKSGQTLGEVSYVDEESGFILIRQSAGQKIPPSTPLLANNLTGSITARLMASPAAKGSFVAADIVSGTPEKGNPVRLDREAKSTEQGASNAAAPTTKRQPPMLEPILPPLDPLSPPSGDIEAPPLPTLNQ